MRPGIVYSAPAAQGIACLYCSCGRSVIWYVILYEGQAEARPKCRTGTQDNELREGWTSVFTILHVGTHQPHPSPGLNANPNPTPTPNPWGGSMLGLRQARRQGWSRGSAACFRGSKNTSGGRKASLDRSDRHPSRNSLPTRPAFRARSQAEGICTDAGVSTCLNKAVTILLRGHSSVRDGHCRTARSSRAKRV